MAEITIIIPAYNESSTLRKCLDSIKNQDYKNFKVIVVDDCSKDGTSTIVKEYGYEVIRLENNSGSGKSRNMGAQKQTQNF